MNEMEEVGEQVVSMMKVVLCKDLSKSIAKWLWQLFSDLVAAGFTREEALQLCQIPSVTGK